MYRKGRSVPRPLGPARARASALLLASVAGLVGCQSMPRGTDQDPLLGGSGAPIGRLPYPGRPADSRTNLGAVPATPPIHPATSPAALAMGAVDAGADRRVPGREVTLQGPRPTEASGPPVVPVASPGEGQSSYEQLQQMLRARGVVWQQLKNTQGDEWEFICAIPHPTASNMRHNYHVKAVGPMGLAAIRAAIDKIDSERR